jgi:hypothetical protein
LADNTDTLHVVQKGGASKIGNLDADPVNQRFVIYTPSGGGQTIYLDWYDGNITTTGGVTGASVTTLNLSASGGSATLTNVNTGAGTFGANSNVLLYSQFDSGQLPGGSGLWAYYCDHATLTASQTDPNSGSTALEMAAPATGGGCNVGLVNSGIQQTITGLTLHGTYTVAVWAKGAAGAETFQLGMANGNVCVSGTVGGAPISFPTTLTTSWQQFACTIPSISTTTGIGFQAWTNTPSATIYVAFGQVGPYGSLTSYLHTTSAAVTANGLTITQPIVSTAGTPSTLSISGNAGTATALAATPGSATGQAVCWKASGVLGYCSSVVGAGGGCTCN